MGGHRKRHPMQPVLLAADDVIRFKENKIIRWLQETGKLDLNEIARMDFSDEDQMQVAQLLGYSVSGFGDLSYASEEMVTAADEKAIKILDKEGR